MQPEAQAGEIPQGIRTDIKEFLRLDDGLKDARLQMKESRDALNEHRESIIGYMRASETAELEVRKGSQKLILQEKIQKVRPETEVIKSKLAELLASGEKDANKIWDEINKCGGTKSTWKLARRSKRKAPAADKDKEKAKPERKRRKVEEDEDS